MSDWLSPNPPDIATSLHGIFLKNGNFKKSLSKLKNIKGTYVADIFDFANFL